MKKLLLVLILAATYSTGIGQAGTLDLTFGNQGIVRTDFPGNDIIYDNDGRQILLHPDGSFYLVIQLNRQTLITHRLANGALDAGYGDGGYSVPVFLAQPVAIMQPDGKIIVGGNPYADSEDFGLARFNTDGTLDNSFSDDGKLITDFFSRRDHLFALTLQSDGKIIAAGRTYDNINDRFALARYNPDGSLDNTFSGDGKQITGIAGSEYALSVAVQNDGRIIAAGLSSSGGVISMAVIRYLPDGSPDNTFSGDGIQIVTLGWYSIATAIAIQNDGKIVVGGFSLNSFNSMRFLLVRFNIDGSLDNSFSGDGIQVNQLAGGDATINDIAIQNDGKIVVTGHANIPGYQEFVIARYNTDGSLDHSFSGDGIDVPSVSSSLVFAPFGAAHSVVIQPDGKIMIAGSYNGPYAVVRYHANGSLDNTFDGDGILRDHKPTGSIAYNAVAVQADGKIVTAGVSGRLSTLGRRFVIARYNTDGSLDNSFSDGGSLLVDFGFGPSEALAVAIQPDGKIVVAGTSPNGVNTDFAVVRLNPDGNFDNTFSGDGKLLTDIRGYNDEASSVLIQADGKIVVGGYSNIWGADDDFAVVRYNTDGSLDNSFSGDGKQVTDFGSSRDRANALAIQEDGKIVQVGIRSHTAFIGHSDFAVVRYNADGAHDNSFDGDGILTTDIAGSHDEAYAVAIQADGKIVVAGRGGQDFVLVRYNSNGSPDDGFSGDGKQIVDFGPTGETATSLVIQQDGKLIAGGFAATGYHADYVLARINPDGTLDNTFSEDGKIVMDIGYGEHAIQGLAIHENRVYAAGRTTYGGMQGLLAAYLINDNVTGCPITVTIPDAVTLDSGVDPNTVYIGYAPAADITLTAQPSGGTAPYSYLWSNGATTSSITVMPTVMTTYSVTVMDALGCNKTESKLVNVTDVRCGNKLDKVLICRVPPGNPSNANSSCVNSNAVASHLGNGSYLGSCKPSLITMKGTSTEEMERTEAKLEIYPNPANVQFRVIFRSLDQAMVNVAIWDALGRIIERRKVNPNQLVELGASYRPGIYFLEMTQGAMKLRSKLVKQGD